MKIILIILVLMTCKNNIQSPKKINETCINGLIVELDDSTKLDGTLIDCDDLNK